VSFDAHALARTFRARFDIVPDGVWVAPGRVNIIGEHTDYNGGPVLPIAIAQSAAIAVAPRADGRLVMASMQINKEPIEVNVADLSPGKLDGWAAYLAGVAWALSQRGCDISRGATLLLDSDVPDGAGLSSSAAIECATALALTGIFGFNLEPREVALIAQLAENLYVGVPCGIMDQMASMLCTAGHALHLDTKSLEAEQLPFDLSSEGLRLVVLDTHAPHRLADGEYANRRATCEAASLALRVESLSGIELAGLNDALKNLDDEVMRRRVRHVVTEIARVETVAAALRLGQMREIGPLLTASHASLRDDFEVTVSELDVAVEAALSAGAYGARMTGGGFGGSIIALVEADQADHVVKAIEAAFDVHGFAAPTSIESIPSAGARRLL
jgi:galactokinase